MLRSPSPRVLRFVMMSLLFKRTSARSHMRYWGKYLTKIHNRLMVRIHHNRPWPSYLQPMVICSLEAERFKSAVDSTAVNEAVLLMLDIVLKSGTAANVRVCFQCLAVYNQEYAAVISSQ